MTEEELAVVEQDMEEDAGAADRGAWAGSCSTGPGAFPPASLLVSPPRSWPPHPIRANLLFSYPISNEDLGFQ